MYPLDCITLVFLCISLLMILDVCPYFSKQLISTTITITPSNNNNYSGNPYLSLFLLKKCNFSPALYLINPNFLSVTFSFFSRMKASLKFVIFLNFINCSYGDASHNNFIDIQYFTFIALSYIVYFLPSTSIFSLGSMKIENFHKLFLCNLIL